MQRDPSRSHFGSVNRPQVRGEQQGNSKLTANDVVEIRFLSLDGLGTAEIAKRYNISPAHVRKLAAGKAWAHVPAARAVLAGPKP